ncbi:hypothetical protein CVT25_012026 [Psilocybe cyanescens]|uniref:Uncharacterized protein n=1 Tax=Psilocybe cyanescens TaxID=93625 RepID=A0A409XH48_PSICY|nr:hypothetical protein CVT25_012026 [Psilocybe cyanescens]
MAAQARDIAVEQVDYVAEELRNMAAHIITKITEQVEKQLATLMEATTATQKSLAQDEPQAAQQQKPTSSTSTCYSNAVQSQGNPTGHQIDPQLVAREGESGAGAQHKAQTYNLIAYYVPVDFETGNRKHIDKMLETNHLHADDLERVRWAKPITHRDKGQKQNYAHLILIMCNTEKANKVICDGLVIHKPWTWTTEYQPPTIHRKHVYEPTKDNSEQQDQHTEDVLVPMRQSLLDFCPSTKNAKPPPPPPTAPTAPKNPHQMPPHSAESMKVMTQEDIAILQARLASAKEKLEQQEREEHSNKSRQGT